MYYIWNRTRNMLVDTFASKKVAIETAINLRTLDKESVYAVHNMKTGTLVDL